MMKFEQQNIFWLVIGLLIGATLAVVGMTLANRTRPAPIVIVPPVPTPQPAPTFTPGPIQVYVHGEVVMEAVYELPPGSLVTTAIDAAGGFTGEANTAVINLAQPLTSGAQIYVPSIQETIFAPTSDAGELSGHSEMVLSEGAPLNINIVSKELLEQLPGIGPSTAQNIVDYRTENGPFVTIEAIMDVPGIGPGKFDDIETLITVEGE